MAGGVRVGIAFDDHTLEPDPTWTYLTDTSNLVASYTIERGRKFEFDVTDAGTAHVSILDKDGVLDPTNPSGPYFGLIEPLVQIQIELWNPVLVEYQSRYRGFVTEYDYAVASWTHQDASGDTVGLTSLDLTCADLFAILQAIEMYPDLVSGAPAFGVDPPTEAAGNIFYDNQSAHNRITDVLTNAGLDSTWFHVFTLNVNLQETTYSPGASVLEVVQDAVDAEFPTVSNAYVDRFGKLAVHGRLAKFTPDTVAAGAGSAWTWCGGHGTPWKIGDGKAIAASPSDTAQLRTFAFNRGWSKIFNYAFCAPKDDDAAADLTLQISRDDTSIDQYGYCPWSVDSLIIGSATGDVLTTAGADTLTGFSAVEACQTFAAYITANYATPRERITELTLKSIDPSDSRAAATWDLLCQVDISDLVKVKVSGPGDGPSDFIFDDVEFFVEGLTETAEPLDGEIALVTLSLDLSPKAYYTPGAWTGD